MGKVISSQTYHGQALQSLPKIKGILTSDEAKVWFNTTSVNSSFLANELKPSMLQEIISKLLHSCYLTYFWCLTFKTQVSATKPRECACRVERTNP